MKGLWRVGVLLLAMVLIAGCGSGKQVESEATSSEGKPAAQTEKDPKPKQGSKKELRTAWVAMDGWDTPETAGFGMAEKRGYFRNIGLSILTLSPPSPKLTIKDVVSGLDAVGVANGPQAVIAKAKGAPIVILSTVIPEPTAALMWPKKSGIGGIADLKGKTIAIPGLPFQEGFLEVILARGGLTLDDVDVVTAGNDLVPALTSGRADAIFGGSWNVEGVALKAKGVDPVIERVQDLGIPDYPELVLISRSDVPPEAFELMQKLAAAVARGGVDATEYPDQAVKALEAGGEANPENSSKTMGAQMRATIPMLASPVETDVGQLEQLADWMHEEGMIEQPLDVSELVAE
jgi:putative hydroxymethylpyrimidine transport system substrate-binding protein